MGRLNPEKLHVDYLAGVTAAGPTMPRRYTLTHSDRTGDLFLSIGSDYNHKQISGWYTRLMRDEVLAEWLDDQDQVALHVYCHVSGGIIFGRASWRKSIFRREMPLVLEAIRHGDQAFFAVHPELETAPILVHFRLSSHDHSETEEWGTLADFRQ
jgi:hypothetical protein